jgi:hypothetical protein
MIRLTSKWFCAAVIIQRDRVVRCAPMLNYMMGWTKQRVLRYARHREWRVEEE